MAWYQELLILNTNFTCLDYWLMPWLFYINSQASILFSFPSFRIFLILWNMLKPLVYSLCWFAWNGSIYTSFSIQYYNTMFTRIQNKQTKIKVITDSVTTTPIAFHVYNICVGSGKTHHMSQKVKLQNKGN